MTSESGSGRRGGGWFKGVAIGTLAMYFYDPEAGNRRRALAADKMRHWAGQAGDILGAAMKDLNNRLRSGRRQGAGQSGDDRVLVARARSRLGHVVTHPGAIDVSARQGRIVLSGAVPESEKQALLEAVRGIAGVTGIDDQLQTHDNPVQFATQSNSPDAQRHDPLEENWTPMLRGAALIGGGVLALYGVGKRSLPGWALAAAGAALVTRSMSDRTANLRTGQDAGKDELFAEKSIFVQASPEAVFDAWSNYENFPQFMSHVIEVRNLGQNRSHWVVEGPAGTRLEWDATLTGAQRPNELAWQSEPGASVENSGRIRFQRQGNGTRVTVRLTYRPPAGAIGNAVATLLGRNPKQEMDDDLLRMKNFIESRQQPERLPVQTPQPPGAGNRNLH